MYVKELHHRVTPNSSPLTAVDAASFDHTDSVIDLKLHILGLCWERQIHRAAVALLFEISSIEAVIQSLPVTTRTRGR